MKKIFLLSLVTLSLLCSCGEDPKTSSNNSIVNQVPTVETDNRVGRGSVDNPISISEALSIIDSYTPSNQMNGRHIGEELIFTKGKVEQIKHYSSGYQFIISKGDVSIYCEDFYIGENACKPEVGDLVVVSGYGMKWAYNEPATLKLVNKRQYGDNPLRAYIERVEGEELDVRVNIMDASGNPSTDAYVTNLPKSVTRGSINFLNIVPKENFQILFVQDRYKEITQVEGFSNYYKVIPENGYNVQVIVVPKLDDFVRFAELKYKEENKAGTTIYFNEGEDLASEFNLDPTLFSLEVDRGYKAQTPGVNLHNLIILYTNAGRSHGLKFECLGPNRIKYLYFFNSLDRDIGRIEIRKDGQPISPSRINCFIVEESSFLIGADDELGARFDTCKIVYY